MSTNRPQPYGGDGRNLFFRECCVGMARYKSKFPELGFYVYGERKKFQCGFYETNDKATISVLDSLKHVERIKETKNEKKSEEKSAEEKSKKATVNKRKSSAK